MGFDINRLTFVATDARREVWPSVTYSYFEYEDTIEGTTVMIEPGLQAAWTGEDEWLLHSRSVFGAHIYCTGVGAALVILLSAGTIFYHEVHCLRFHQGATFVSGLELSGWRAQFKLVANGVNSTIEGCLHLRSL